MMTTLNSPAAGIQANVRRSVYDTLNQLGPVTKNELVTATGLSLPTVTKYLTHLRKLGLVTQGEKLASSSKGGRNPVTYQSNPDGRLAVGVDITDAHFNIVLADLDGEVSHIKKVLHPFENTDAYAKFVASQVQDHLRDSNVEDELVEGVGIAVPGLVNEDQEVTYGRVLDNAGMTKDYFGRFLPFYVRLVHDSDASGLAEFWNRTAIENAFYLSVSNSIGGSVLVDGKIFYGDGDFAGEVGHLVVVPGGKKCYCGQNGCLDAYCNANVLRQAGGGLRLFFKKLSARDPAMQKVWDTYCSQLAIAIHTVRILFGNTIILGGDVGANMGDNLRVLQEKVDDLVSLPGKAADYLVRSQYTTKPTATGAALYIIEAFKAALGPADAVTSLEPNQTLTKRNAVGM